MGGLVSGHSTCGQGQHEDWSPGFLLPLPVTSQQCVFYLIEFVFESSELISTVFWTLFRNFTCSAICRFIFVTCKLGLAPFGAGLKLSVRAHFASSWHCSRSKARGESLLEPRCLGPLRVGCRAGCRKQQFPS